MAQLKLLIILWYAFAIRCINCGTFAPQIRSNISHNEIISDIFMNSTYNQTHYHQLIINSSYEVHFEDCHSNIYINTQLRILDGVGNIIAVPDAPNLSGCFINFTISLNKGTYYLKIEPYNNNTTAGSYQLKIVFLPNCDYYVAGNHMIVPSQSILEWITIIDDQIEIEFDIKINEQCNHSLCNILHLGNSTSISYPSLSINGNGNYFNISLRDNTHWLEIYVPNADAILDLSTDEFHHIYLSLKPKEKIFAVDSVAYYFVINPLQSQIDNYFIVELEEMNSNAKENSTSTIWHPSYPLYISDPWNIDNGINGSVQNICVRSAPNIVGSIQCNTRYNGYDVSIGDIKYYKLLLPQSIYYITFNFVSLFIRYIFSFRLYDNDFNVLYELQSHKLTITAMSNVVINALDAGQYLIRLEFIGHGSFAIDDWFNIALYCIYKSSADKYILTPGSVGMNWIQSELHCETEYGTSLATILSQQDIFDAIRIMNASTMSAHWNNYLSLDEVWIGMYKHINWQWIDGTLCDQNGTGYCVNDESPYHENLLSCPALCSCDDINSQTILSMNVTGAVAAYLWLKTNGAVCQSAAHIAILQDSIDRAVDGFLCNAYGIYEHCNATLNCWKNIEFVNNSLLNEDIILEYYDTSFDSHEEECDVTAYYPANNDYEQFGTRPFRPPIAFWNWTLFVFGLRKVHFTNLTLPLFEDLHGLHGYEWNWNHELYDVKGGGVLEMDQHEVKEHIIMKSQRYAQYRSSLFLYTWTAAGDMLTHINLDKVKPTSKSYEIPQKSSFTVGLQYIEDKCMVSNGDYVYIITPTNMLIFSLANEEWSNIQGPTAWTGSSLSIGWEWTEIINCAILNYNIYILDSYACDSQGNCDKYSCDLYKYDIRNNEAIKINTLRMCNNEVYTRSVMASNNKIYIHGSDASSWNTIIFDTKTERFETNKMGIDIPTDIAHYRRSELAIFDDNVLLLFYINGMEKTANIHYGITNLISINFTQTMTTIWPSDGFFIKYYLNDFTNSYIDNNSYHILLYCNDTVHSDIINALLVLNTSVDGCICNQIYNCFNCKQHFNLSNYLTLPDNTISELKFYTTYNGNYNDTLLRPNYISIKLERCEIAFINNNSISTKGEPFILFSYSMSPNCNTRNGTTFSLNITSKQADIHKNMKISIVEDQQICQMCDVYDYHCDNCSSKLFKLQHGLTEDTTFNVVFESNMIDLAVPEPYDFALIHSNSDMAGFWERLSDGKKVAIVLGSVIFILMLFGSIYYFYKRFSDEKTRRLKFAKDIYNPMVIAISIEWYDDEAENPGINVHCNNLNGVDRDYKNIATLCNLLNWKIYPEEEQFEWTEKEILEFIEQRAQQLSDNIINSTESTGTGTFDGIFVVLSGHGYKNSIISSDYQLISKTSIHRMFTTNFPVLRQIARVFVFDCCDGDQERSSYPAESKQNDGESTEQGKNYKVENIEIKQQDRELWKSDQKNPDYMLSIIHAANEGFQAKMNAVDGSYLIYEFVKRMMANVDGNKNLFLGEIVDGIQEDLHDQGKQQITSTFNNNTRYLRFKPKYDEKEEDNILKLGTIRALQIVSSKTPPPTE